jgi:WhiB family redox-sensing transcriptional regulator
MKLMASEELAWQMDAPCAQTDPEIFFPEDKQDVRLAKTICKTCPVISQCLAFALENSETFGVWGGTTARERQILRNRGKGRPRIERLAS